MAEFSRLVNGGGVVEEERILYRIEKISYYCESVNRNRGVVKRYHDGLHPALREGLDPKPKSMYCVYLLKSRSRSRFYVGYTNDLKRRWLEHCQGKVYSTRRFAPWTLVYYEAYPDKARAQLREKKLKDHGSSYHGLLKRLGYK